MSEVLPDWNILGDRCGVHMYDCVPEGTSTSEAVKYKYWGAELMLGEQISLPGAGVLGHYCLEIVVCIREQAIFPMFAFLT